MTVMHFLVPLIQLNGPKWPGAHWSTLAKARDPDRGRPRSNATHGGTTPAAEGALLRVVRAICGRNCVFVPVRVKTF